MKFVLLTAVVLFSTVSYALPRSIFEDVNESFCPEKLINYGTDTLFCKASNAKVVIDAKVGPTVTKKEYSKLGFTTTGVIDAGIVPDGDSNTAYFFTRWLVDAAGNRVGVITYEGWYNDEMEASARFDTRYNLKGETVMVSTRNL